jgi:hypothetical protein
MNCNFQIPVASWKFGALRDWISFRLEENAQTQKGAALARLTGTLGVTS